MANLLSQETSPYLQQHAENPVDWHPWGEEALALARSGNKPILLSIGYSACHWCHVMAHESFEDEQVAATMNRLFVNIKVDREERPDLDQIYQTAHQVLTGRPGGWPLTVFMTPDGMPFFAGTYFPKTPRHGLPAFTDICERIAEVHASRPDAVAEQNRSLADIMAGTLPRPMAGVELNEQPIRMGREALLRNFDSRFGGFGGAPKFPHAPDLAFLLRRGAEGDDRARAAALNSLTRMAEGGIYDQIGGGFCRYSVDERWEIPHFEKMLYDNGLLLGLYADAWVLSGEPLYARVVEETAAWVMREMQLPQGGYASSLDADSAGEEGSFYLWDPQAVSELLTAEEWQAAQRCWGLDAPPNFENSRWHLKVARPPEPEDLPLLASARTKLLVAREARPRPGRDDKVLTAWNALMIGGLARAARIFGRADWRDSARRALHFVQATLWQPTGSGGSPILLATAKDGRAHLNAYLDDYAFLIQALLEMLQADFRPEDLAFARKLADSLLARFEDREHGGFHFTAHDHEVLIHRPKPVHDNALPAGNGVAALALARLGHLLGEVAYLEAAERSLRLFWPQLLRDAGGISSQLQALQEVLRPRESVILRGPGAAVADWSLRLARLPGMAGLVLPISSGFEALPAALDKPCGPEVNAWVCSGVSCQAPLADFEKLRGVLQAA
jgi:uncharacterized protein YyaL (SSP411 family)